SARTRFEPMKPAPPVTRTFRVTYRRFPQPTWVGRSPFAWQASAWHARADFSLARHHVVVEEDRARPRLAEARHALVEAGAQRVQQPDAPARQRREAGSPEEQVGVDR